MESNSSKSKQSAKPSTLRWTGSVALLFLLAAASPFTGVAGQKDAVTVLSGMRQALGGAASLDAVKTFSVSGTRTLDTPDGSRRMALEWFAALPDHFLEVWRDSLSGPMSSEIAYYFGIAGARPIRKTVSSFPMPEVRYADNSPQAAADRERAFVRLQQQSFARLLLALSGASTAAYPLQFSYGGVEQAERKVFDVIDASGADGFRCRLHVDSTTQLPAMLTWMDERPHVVTTTSTSTVTTRNGQVVSQSPPDMSNPVIPPGNRGMAPKRWIFSDFKAQDGINWPRRIEQEFDGKSEEIRLTRVRINPKIDAKKFDIK